MKSISSCHRNEVFQWIESQVQSQGYVILSNSMKLFNDNSSKETSAIIHRYIEKWLSDYELLCDLVVQTQNSIFFTSKLYRQLIQGQVNIGQYKISLLDQQNLKSIKPTCLYKCSLPLQSIKRFECYKIGKKRKKYINKTLLEKQERVWKENRKIKEQERFVIQQKEIQVEIKKRKSPVKAKLMLKFSDFSEKESQQIAEKVSAINSYSFPSNIETKQQINPVVIKNQISNSKQAHSKPKSKQTKREMQRKEMQKQSKFLSGWISKSKAT